MEATTANTNITGKPRSMAGFFALFVGQAVSLLGSELVQFALVWWLTKESGGSATALAMASLVGLLPPVFLGPFAGALVERWNRRAVMMAADGAIALATLALAALFALDVAQVYHVYALMFVRALGGAFHWPAMQASTTLMVPERHLARVAGMNQAIRGVAGIAMPSIQQAVVPPEIQGRVLTLARSGMDVMSPLGMLVAGPVADAVGAQGWYLLTGGVIAAMGVGAFFIPPLIRLEET